LNEYRRQGSKGKIIFPSTRLVYDHASNADEKDVTEDFKTIYAINKYACEKYLEMYNRVYGVRYSIFRICLPYGTLIPGATSYGTAEFMLGKAEKGEDISLYGDGSVRRTLTHMEDLCSMLIKGAFSEETENSILNIGGEDYSLKEMAEAIAKKYGVGVTYVPYPEVAEKIESGDTVFNDRKYRDAVKYKREHTFQSWIDS
ncbi:MAG: NAD(P)-dependent oxidoreductase, partial [Lachnospiraceae bacterium]|nr:NAD(P)-dependent oxidoreductase [Lachnospiraceae bacterium]